ncbi:uncharacterized protein LOC141988388 [Natator depressus]|uniref:uncharacterized protein LOC141988388 n=1 Tax=Natator depressus TaxID=27790 RepID=UPI003EB88BC7
MGLADLLVPLLFLGVAGDPLTIYTLPSSSAVLGSAALLKCRFNIGGPINLTTLQVRWYFSDRSVAQYDRGKETFAPGVSISQQELLIGNASLGMESVRVLDEGQYRCVVGYGAERQQSETTLRVLAAPRLSIPRRAARRDAASSFPCHVRGFYPGDVTVAWLRDGRVLADATRSAPQRNPDGTFNLTLTYTFTPTANDSGSLFSCHVSHAALAQPLQEGFPLAVTAPRAGADHTSAAIGATLGILVAGGAAAAVAIYCWRKRREGPYSAVETPPEDPAGSRDKTRGEDTVLMANDGLSDAGKGPEQQPLLPAQGQDQSEIQEQEDRAPVTGPYSAVETPPEDPAGSRDKTRGEDTVLMANDGVSDAGKGPEQQPLLPAQGQDQSEIQEQEDRAPVTGPYSAVETPPEDPAGSRDKTRGEDTVLMANDGVSDAGKGPEQQPLLPAQGQDQSEIQEQEDRAPVTGRGAPYSVSEVLGPARCLLGQEVTLSCAMGGTFPEDTAVTWERIHGEDRTVIGTDGVSEAGEGPELQPLLHPQPHGWRATQERSGTCLTASLSFTPTVQDDGARVRCSFHHEARGIREQRESGEIRPWARPQVSGIQVLPEWEPREEVPFAVQIQNFYPRGIHRIQWSCDGKAWEKCEPTDCRQNPDLTFSETSVWRIPSDQITRPEFTVTVSVQQSPQEPPIEREIRAGDTGLLRPPEVSEISQPESVTAGEEITLSCRMAGHFPGDLRVTWLKRDRGAGAADPLQDSAKYSIEPGAPCTQDGKSFQQETRLRFTPSVQRDQGAEYVCRVGHAALGNLPIEKQTRALEVTDSARTQPSKSENSRREEEPAGSGEAAAVTGPLVEEGAGDTAPKGQAGGDGGAETKSASDTRRGITMAQNDTASPTPAKGGITSDASAEGQEGDSTADEDTTSELAESGPGGARPAVGVVGRRVASTTPVTQVLPDAVVRAPPAGGPDPEAQASATRGGDDADSAERVEELGAHGTADASPGNCEQTA